MKDTKDDCAAVEERKKDQDVVDRIHEMLKKESSPLADEFLSMKYVREAQGKPSDEQRRLINRQLHLHLGVKTQDTSIARLALDDKCDLAEYLRNFKRYTLPQL
jgi:lysine/ornithine N-monooxygenase